MAIFSNKTELSNVDPSTDQNFGYKSEFSVTPYVFILIGQRDIKVTDLNAIRSLIGCSKYDIKMLKDKHHKGHTDWNDVLQNHMEQILKDSRIDLIVLIDYRTGIPILEKYFPFKNLIDKAKELCTDVLLGNATGMKMPVRVSRNLFWIDSFRHTEFIVVFRSIFSNLKNYLDSDREDHLIDHINKAKNKFLLYPYIYFTDVPFTSNNSNIPNPITPYRSEMKRLSIINGILDRYNYRGS